MIKVSVIIPVYNVEPYLKEALDSVINQTLREIEIICIDDCSTDETETVVNQLQKQDNRIKYIKIFTHLIIIYNFIELYCYSF